ncbi:MAG: hypothetical protein H6719_31340 [Sandaracinaceae bacterium]|nr:hypothetical protein [Sandaracinaceae bacterium]
MWRETSVLVALVTACCWPAPTQPPDPTPTEFAWPAETTRCSLLGDRLVLTVPVGPNAPTREPYPVDPGRVERDFIYAGQDPGVELSLEDLPAELPEADVEAAVARELGQGWPSAALFGQISSMPVSAPDVRVWRAAMQRRADGERPIAAYLVVLPDGHPIAIRAEVPLTATGSDDDGRALADAIVSRLEVGAGRWTAPPGDRRGDELYEAVTVPAGWAHTLAMGGNEDPPYETPFQETLAPVRAVGAPARVAVVARSGLCASRPAGLDPPWWSSSTPAVEVPGTMFGQPMVWRAFGPTLCWEIPDPEDGHGGEAWELWATSEADRALALEVAASATRR